MNAKGEDMNTTGQNRRDFIRNTAAATAGLSLAMSSAASYARILGANDRMNIAGVGVRSRGAELLRSAFYAAGGKLHIDSICDVDSRELAEKSTLISELTGHTPAKVNC